MKKQNNSNYSPLDHDQYMRDSVDDCQDAQFDFGDDDDQPLTREQQMDIWMEDYEQ